jgi:hypothetical protein
LFGDFTDITGPSDFRCPFIVGVRPWTSRRGPQLHPLRASTGPLGSRAKCFRTWRVSDRAGPSRISRYDAPVQPSAYAYSVGVPKRHNFAAEYPARTYPVNGSALPLREAPHDSGPLWVASPSTYDFFIHNTSPVYPSAQAAYVLQRSTAGRKRLLRFPSDKRTYGWRHPPVSVLTAAFAPRDELAAHFPDGHEHDRGVLILLGLHRMAAAELRHALSDCGCFGGPDGGRAHQLVQLVRVAEAIRVP